MRNMRKVFLMIANSKDKEEKIIESLKENSLLTIDEKKDIVIKIKTMHDFFKLMVEDEKALDRTVRTHFRDYRGVMKTIGISKFKKVYKLLADETEALLLFIADCPNFLFAQFDKSVLGLFMTFFSKPIMHTFTLKEIGIQLDLYLNQFAKAEPFKMTENDVKYYNNLTTIEQYNKDLEEQIRKFNSVKNKGAEND